MIIYAVLFVLLLAADIISKAVVSTKMELFQSIPLIKDVFHITYQLNDVGAMGLNIPMFILIGLSVVVVLAVAAYLFIKKPKNKLLNISLTMILAGGVGNLIDRIRLGKVVDFLDFQLINFWIFNIADVWVTIGAALFICLLLFSREDIL